MREAFYQGVGMGRTCAAWRLFTRRDEHAHGVRPNYPAWGAFTRRAARDNGVGSIAKTSASVMRRSKSSLADIIKACQLRGKRKGF